MYHSLVNNSDEGDVDVFDAVSVQCVYCRAESILRKGNWTPEEAYHKMDCHFDRQEDDAPLESIDAGWYYAYGVEGYAWDEGPVGPWADEDKALREAMCAYWDNITSAAVARVEASQEY